MWNGVRAVRWYVWLASGAGAAVLASGTALACRHGCACCAAAAPRVTNITNITNYYGRARPHESRVGWAFYPKPGPPRGAVSTRGPPSASEAPHGPLWDAPPAGSAPPHKGQQKLQRFYASVPARVQPAFPGTSRACSLGVCSTRERAGRRRGAAQGRGCRAGRRGKNWPAAPRRAPRRATCARCTRRACSRCRPAARQAARPRGAPGAAAAQAPAPLARIAAAAAAAATTTAARPASLTRASGGKHRRAHSLPFSLRNTPRSLSSSESRPNPVRRRPVCMGSHACGAPHADRR